MHQPKENSKRRNADDARDSADYDGDRLIRIDQRLFAKSDSNANISKVIANNIGDHTMITIVKQPITPVGRVHQLPLLSRQSIRSG